MKSENKKIGSDEQGRPIGFVCDNMFNVTFEENEDLDESLDKALEETRKSIFGEKQ